MTGTILREVRKKRRKWKKAKHGNAQDREEYEETAKKVKNMIRNAKRGLEKNLANEKYHNSKPFYSYIKKKNDHQDNHRAHHQQAGEHCQ